MHAYNNYIGIFKSPVGLNIEVCKRYICSSYEVVHGKMYLNIGKYLQDGLNLLFQYRMFQYATYNDTEFERIA